MYGQKQQQQQQQRIQVRSILKEFASLSRLLIVNFDLEMTNDPQCYTFVYRVWLLGLLEPLRGGVAHGRESHPRLKLLVDAKQTVTNSYLNMFSGEQRGDGLTDSASERCAGAGVVAGFLGVL